MNPLHGLSIFFFALGAIVVFLSKYLKRKNQNWMLNAEPVKGILDSIEEKETVNMHSEDVANDKAYEYYLHFKYKVKDEEYSLRHFNGTNSWGYDVGDEVDLRYNRDDHSDAKLYSWWTNSGAYSLVSLAGMALVGLALFTLYKAMIYQP